ncbi:MAG: DUF4230 domain-containing protein [Bacteroidales bacterium]|nr:DUF4230 domain-containing protein [Bacteroidales bacterium]
MIISFLLKNIRSIIDALIIAAIIVVFVIFDPFKWFNTGINIRNTPVSVQNIREIRQLITAEYYGEAIASLSESYMEEIAPKKINEEGQNLFINLITAVDSLRKTDKPGWFTFDAIHKWNIESRLGEYFPWITHSKLYPNLMKCLCDTINKGLPANKKFDTKKLLFELYDNKGICKGSSFEISKETELVNLTKYFKSDIKLQEKKKNIVYIGRGWVKAGIDFGKLKPDDIFYNSSNSTLYIKNCEPEILNCDINPWFIPNKVKGFELIKQKGSFDNPFAEAVKVKKACIENLRLQAMNSGIINQARKNARESLMNLFSLLMDSNVKQVVFTKNKFEQILNEIQKDTLISNQEAVFINELTAKSLKDIDTAFYSDYRMQLADLSGFCSKLQSFKYAGNPVNGISLDMAPFLQNDKIDTIELDKAIKILCTTAYRDSAAIKNDMYRLMASYRIPQNDFIDSSLTKGIINYHPKTDFQYKMASLTRIYRDSLYNRALNKCTKVLKTPKNRYAIWFKSRVDYDSTLIQTARYLQTKCDANMLKVDKSALINLSKDTTQVKRILGVFRENVEIVKKK